MSRQRQGPPPLVLGCGGTPKFSAPKWLNKLTKYNSIQTYVSGKVYLQWYPELLAAIYCLGPIWLRLNPSSVSHLPPQKKTMRLIKRTLTFKADLRKKTSVTGLIDDGRWKNTSQVNLLANWATTIKQYNRIVTNHSNGLLVPGKQVRLSKLVPELLNKK